MSDLPIKRVSNDEFDAYYKEDEDVTRVYLVGDTDAIVLQGKWDEVSVSFVLTGWRAGMAQGMKIGRAQQLVEIKNSARLLRDIIGI